MHEVTVYHNPQCSTSRNVLGLIRGGGIEPRVVRYLDTPLSRAELASLIATMGVSVRDVLRQRGTPYDELDLGNAKWSDDQLLDFMVQHPILLNRPIVVSSKGARLCRPSETVMELLAAA